MVEKARKGKHRRDRRDDLDRSSFANWTRLGLIAVHVYEALRQLLSDVL